MKNDPTTGRPVLEAPNDLLGFELWGMTMTRETGLHQPGRYRAVVKRSTNEYVVTSGNSRRFPWKIWDGAGRPFGTARDLIHVVEVILGRDVDQRKKS